MAEVKRYGREFYHGDDVVEREDGEYVRFEDHTAIVAALERERDSFKSAYEASTNRCEHLKLQAQANAQEMRTHKSTVHEIYQVLTGATGEPGNWNGSDPARKAMAEKAALERRLRVAERAVELMEEDGLTVAGLAIEKAEREIDSEQKEQQK